MNAKKRQSAVNYYERIDEKTAEDINRRKTAVERWLFIKTRSFVFDSVILGPKKFLTN